MDGIGGVIFVIFMIISIASSASKNKQKQQNANKTNTSTNSRTNIPGLGNIGSTIVNEIKNAIEETKEVANNQQASVPKYQSSQNSQMQSTSVRMNENLKDRANDLKQNQKYKSLTSNLNDNSASLEGYQMEGQQVEGYKVEGYKVEGYQVEGLKRPHRHVGHADSNSEKRIAKTENSMGEGFSGEGCEEDYNFAFVTSSRKRKSNKNGLQFSDNPFVQGIIVSQILERPKRR